MPNHQYIDSEKFGLSRRTPIRELGQGKYGIVKKRKSRIIMKDGFQVFDIASAILSAQPDSKILLIHSGPICSKTIRFLNEKNIDLYYEK